MQHKMKGKSYVIIFFPKVKTRNLHLGQICIDTSLKLKLFV